MFDSSCRKLRLTSIGKVSCFLSKQKMSLSRAGPRVSPSEYMNFQSLNDSRLTNNVQCQITTVLTLVRRYIRGFNSSVHPKGP